MNTRTLVIVTLVFVLLVAGGQVVSTLTSTDLNPAGAGADAYLVVNAVSAPSYQKRIEHGIQSGVDNDSWTTVNFVYSYASAVVIATPSYTSSEPPLTTSIQNVSSTSFDV